MMQLRGRLWRQRRILTYACIGLNLIRFSLWLLPFQAVRHGLARVADYWITLGNRPSVAAIVWAVTIASVSTPGGARCLAKALTTQLLLTHYGYAHQLHIGVAMDAAQTMAAHAWVEYQGQVIMGYLHDLDRFQPLSNPGVIL